MKVLQVNCVYPGGSTGGIVQNIQRELLARGDEAVVYYGRGPVCDEAHTHKIGAEWYGKMNNLRARVTGMPYGGCECNTARLLSRIRRERPDVVHLHCINGFFVNVYRLLQWLKKQHIPTVLTLHAEFMHTANCVYALDCERWKIGCGQCPRLYEAVHAWLFDRTATSWRRMQRAFAGFDKLAVCSVSPWLCERAKQAPILQNFSHRVVLNGLDTTVFRGQPDAVALRQRYTPRGEKLVLHVTPHFQNRIKGGQHVLALAQRLRDYPVRFLIVGEGTPSDLPDNVEAVGRISDRRQLAALYTAADVTLLTSQKETFSMVCAESLCCGTPVVGFCAGAPEQIALPAYSRFVEQGNVPALEEALLRCLEQLPDKEDVQRQAHSTYSQSRMVQEYISLYKELV